MVTDTVRQASIALKSAGGELPYDRLMLSLAVAIESLILNQNSDGGWAEAAGSRSMVYLTSRAIQALCATGISPEHEVMNDGLSFLREAFLSEHSGWGSSTLSSAADDKISNADLMCKGKVLKQPPKYERMVAWHIYKNVHDVKVQRAGS